MKPTLYFLIIPSLVVANSSTPSEQKTCVPSFDYCANMLLEKKGFTESDLRNSLSGTDFANASLDDVLFHCRNPGDVGHPKLCPNGCHGPEHEGSHGC